MNRGTNLINKRIQKDIVSINPSKIKFINVDDQFECHRFCEPSKTNIEDAAGANDPNTWFISLGIILEEVESTQVSPESPFSELQQTSVFHPKSAAHEGTALKIAEVVKEFQRQNGHNPGPSQNPDCTTR